VTYYTSPDNLPAPDDYQQPADTPAVMRALADATQAALTARPGAVGSVHGPWALSSATEGAYTLPHGLPRVPVAVVATATDDDGLLSVVCSLGGWDATNVTVRAKNIGGAAETFRICLIAI
jgi:hypothetical protein